MKSNDASSALIAGSLLSLNGRTYSKNLLIHFDVELVILTKSFHHPA